jgi:hypothetical protein
VTDALGPLQVVRFCFQNRTDTRLTIVLHSYEPSMTFGSQDEFRPAAVYCRTLALPGFAFVGVHVRSRTDDEVRAMTDYSRPSPTRRGPPDPRFFGTFLAECPVETARAGVDGGGTAGFVVQAQGGALSCAPDSAVAALTPIVSGQAP